MQQLDNYLTSFERLVRTVPCVVAVTHRDEAANDELASFARYLVAKGTPMPVVEVDPRSRQDVAYLINLLLDVSCPEPAHV